MNGHLKWKVLLLQPHSLSGASPLPSAMGPNFHTSQPSPSTLEDQEELKEKEWDRVEGDVHGRSLLPHRPEDLLLSGVQEIRSGGQLPGAQCTDNSPSHSALSPSLWSSDL